MVNFVYFLWNIQGKQSQFFGIKEWDNLHDIPDECKRIITTAFHDPNYNLPLGLESVNTIIDDPTISIIIENIALAFESRLINLLYYCDDDGLNDSYFSNLVFKYRTSSLKILHNCNLRKYFNIDFSMIVKKKNSQMNLFLLIDPYRKQSIVDFSSSKDLHIFNFDYLNLKTLKLHELASKAFSEKNLIIKLSSNKIDSIQPSTFGEFKTLSILYLSYNKLTEFELDLGCLESLKELNLSNNFLKTITFSSNSGGVLAKLSLQNNFIDDTKNIWNHIQKLINLQELYLEENKLESIKLINEKTIERLLCLKKFYLYDNLFSESDLNLLILKVSIINIWQEFLIIYFYKCNKIF